MSAPCGRLAAEPPCAERVGAAFRLGKLTGRQVRKREADRAAPARDAPGGMNFVRASALRNPPAPHLTRGAAPLKVREPGPETARRARRGRRRAAGTRLAKVQDGVRSPPPDPAAERAGKVLKQTQMGTLTQGLEHSAADAAQAPQSEEPRARATVLLAEDDRALRRYLEVVLRRAGYEVLPAADGLEAMKALLSNAVDAVVTDALMPHLSGHELCRFLREHPQLKGLPVVLLSGADPASLPEESGADLYLSKPVPAEELSAGLARLLA